MWIILLGLVIVKSCFDIDKALANPLEPFYFILPINPLLSYDYFGR